MKTGKFYESTRRLILPVLVYFLYTVCEKLDRREKIMNFSIFQCFMYFQSFPKNSYRDK